MVLRYISHAYSPSSMDRFGRSGSLLVRGNLLNMLENSLLERSIILRTLSE